ncbi:ASP-6 protein [Aphelenchoides avenae]|nr:ASP-6 protein [Aphelenchus avenae]
MFLGATFLTVIGLCVAADAAVIRVPVLSYAKGPVGHRHERSTHVATPVDGMWDIEYFGNITVGGPPQWIRVHLDTASDDTWVVDDTCHDPESTQTQLKCQRLGSGYYDSTKSSSFKDLQESWHTGTMDGSYANGTLSQDTLRLGNDGESQLTVNDAAFGRATYIKYGAFGGASGSIGLAPNSKFLDAVAKQGVLDENIVSVFIKKTGPSGDFQRGYLPAGQFTYGALDTENCHEDVTYEPLDERWASNYAVSLKDISVNSQSFAVENLRGMIFDTANSYIRLPSEMFQAVVAATGARKKGRQYIVDCNAQISLALTIGEKAYTLNQEQLIITYLSDVRQCQLAVAAGTDFISVGNPFMRKYCQVFDFGKKRLGFADVKQAS